MGLEPVLFRERVHRLSVYTLFEDTSRRDNYWHIAECKEHLSKFRIAVEFRSRYWFDDNKLEETLSFLRRGELSFICVDEPQGFESSVPPLADVTGEIAIVRFHGQNKDTWEAKGLKSASSRFDYYYEAEELEQWVPKVDSFVKTPRQAGARQG